MYCDLRVNDVPSLVAAAGNVANGLDAFMLSENVKEDAPPYNLRNMGGVVKFQGEELVLSLEWLMSESGRIGVEFSTASKLVAAIQARTKAWCNTQ